ncbi:hypothetical protein [Rickettsia sp. TH2014]|uniref:hypothetical protein n=1 Tax=Rickettsia sp. TH2014 TaxID=1967503 RepID=UPI001C4434B9|nr:hypothetical protein [Rickettsia sp. TH2014]
MSVHSCHPCVERSVIARRNCKFRRSNLRSLLLFHEIATQPMVARNDGYVE